MSNNHIEVIRDKRDAEKELMDAFGCSTSPPISASDWWVKELSKIPPVFTPVFDKTNSRKTIAYAFRFLGIPERQDDFWGSGRREEDMRTRWYSSIELVADPRWESSQQGRQLGWWLPHSLYQQLYGYAQQHNLDPHDPEVVWHFSVTKRGAHAPPKYMLKKGIKPKPKKRRNK